MYKAQVVQNQQIKPRQTVIDSLAGFDVMLAHEFQRSCEAVLKDVRHLWRDVADFDDCYIHFVNNIVLGSCCFHPAQLSEGKESTLDGSLNRNVDDTTHDGEASVKVEDKGPDGGQDYPIEVDSVSSEEAQVKSEDDLKQRGEQVKSEDDVNQRGAESPGPVDDVDQRDAQLPGCGDEDLIPQDDQNVPIVHQQGDGVPPAMAHDDQLEGIPREAQAQAQDPI